MAGGAGFQSSTVFQASGIFDCFISAFLFRFGVRTSVHSANRRCRSFRCSGDSRAASAWSACKALPQGGLLMYQDDTVDGWKYGKFLTHKTLGGIVGG